MVDQTIAISLLGSLFINIISISIQRHWNRVSRKKQTKRTWYSNVRSSCRQLRRKAGALPSGISVDPTTMTMEPQTPPGDETDASEKMDVEMQSLKDTLTELEALYDDRPDNVSTNVESALSNLFQWYDSHHHNGDFSTIDIKSKLVDQSDEIIDYIQDDYPN